jgi:hypothetical protein
MSLQQFSRQPSLAHDEAIDPDYDEVADVEYDHDADPDYDEGGQGEFADGFTEPDYEDAGQEYRPRKQKQLDSQK